MTVVSVLRKMIGVMFDEKAAHIHILDRSDKTCLKFVC